MKRLSNGVGIAVWTACAWIVSGASALDVRGSVRSGEEVKPRQIEAVRAPYWNEWNGFIDPRKPSIDYPREVSAALVGPAALRDATTVTLRDGALLPSTIVVPHGTQLRIRNDDDFAHELYAEGLKGFEPVASGPGQTRTIQLDQTGVFELRDKLAPHVRGTLHVVAKVTQVVQPNADGSFVFSDVAPGSYVVKLFRGPLELAGGAFEVSSSKDIVLDPVALDARPSGAKPGK